MALCSEHLWESEDCCHSHSAHSLVAGRSWALCLCAWQGVGNGTGWWKLGWGCGWGWELGIGMGVWDGMWMAAWGVGQLPGWGEKFPAVRHDKTKKQRRVQGSRGQAGLALQHWAAFQEFTASTQNPYRSNPSVFLLLLHWEPVCCSAGFLCCLSQCAWKAALVWSSRCLEQNCDLGFLQNKQAPLGVTGCQ